MNYAETPFIRVRFMQAVGSIIVFFAYKLPHQLLLLSYHSHSQKAQITPLLLVNMNSAQNPKCGQKPTVVITGGDYYLGHEFARLLLSEKRGDFARLSVTMAHPERGRQLERAGAEIKQIKYDDDNSLTNAFGGEVNWVVLVPDPEEETRVQYTKKLVDAMQNAGKVANVVVISSAAAEEQEREHLKEFKEIENYVKEKGQNWVILRLVFSHSVLLGLLVALLAIYVILKLYYYCTALLGFLMFSIFGAPKSSKRPNFR